MYIHTHVLLALCVPPHYVKHKDRIWLLEEMLKQRSPWYDLLVPWCILTEWVENVDWWILENGSGSHEKWCLSCNCHVRGQHGNYNSVLRIGVVWHQCAWLVTETQARVVYAAPTESVRVFHPPIHHDIKYPYLAHTPQPVVSKGTNRQGQL